MSGVMFRFQTVADDATFAATPGGVIAEARHVARHEAARAGYTPAEPAAVRVAVVHAPELLQVVLTVDVPVTRRRRPARRDVEVCGLCDTRPVDLSGRCRVCRLVDEALDVIHEPSPARPWCGRPSGARRHREIGERPCRRCLDIDAERRRRHRQTTREELS